ncbi:MAG: HAD hydrolase family protein [Rhodospirillales bacterium]|nr:HAD hydrolase family protein [Rhodospirillales bacterium]
MATRAGKTLDAAALRRRLRTIRLLSLDVDGVLTDGGLYYGDNGTVTRKFNVQDGVGIKRVLALGVKVAFVSAGTTRSIHHRARTLGVRHVLSGVADKHAEIVKLSRSLGVPLAAVAHIGDDFNDLPLLKAVGLPLSVPNAVPEARASAHYVTRRCGGEGAVREICDLLAENANRGMKSGNRPVRYRGDG